MLRETIKGIEIITPPQSKAPPELAEKWVGVRIPLAPHHRQDNLYHVYATTALKQLGKKDPEAAQKLASIYEVEDLSNSEEAATDWILWTFALHECRLVDMIVDHDYS